MKRLKKHCPCEKCQKWRAAKACKREMDKAVASLAKALEVGTYNTAPDSLRGGGPLQVEPLEIRLTPGDSAGRIQNNGVTPVYIGVREYK